MLLQALSGEGFALDWSRTASESRMRQFIEGWARSPKQLADITATWELKRGWNHGNDPDCSMYTKRIVKRRSGSGNNSLGRSRT